MKTTTCTFSEYEDADFDAPDGHRLVTAVQVTVPDTTGHSRWRLFWEPEKTVTLDQQTVTGGSTGIEIGGGE